MSSASGDERSEVVQVRLRARGALDALDATTVRAICDRSAALNGVVRAQTASIIARVRADGDDALRSMAREFDGVALSTLEVPRASWATALDTLDSAVRNALMRSVRNITAVHEAFRPTAMRVSSEPGVEIVRRPDALNRVGVYAPGGRAAYPSSLLMGAIPARVAGVNEVTVCSPPGADGLPAAIVLAAAALAGVDRVFAVGGAGAIAAMAYGTDSILRVDRIVGPGNAYVAEAKMQVMRDVSIDAPAGPSELLVLADSSADVACIARELVAQAEHDPDAAVIAVVCGDDAVACADAIERTLATILQSTPRADIARKALGARGAIVTVDSLERGVAFANAWCAEHVLIVVRAGVQGATLAELRNAGTVFVGESSSVAFGDYMTGANHVLPTAGAARCYSGLSTLDFVRWTTTQTVTRDAASAMAHDVGVFADAEGLPAHAAAARAWAAP